MHRLLPQIAVIICVFWSTCLASDDSLVVDTAAGSVRGRMQNVIHGLSVKQFLGIPYAQPPVGQLRFARPQPAMAWDGVRDAVKFGPICPQFSIRQFFSLPENMTIEEEPQDEDCLFLNVYTPSQATSQDKLAVMVWIHGGGFTSGSGSSYNPSVLVTHHNVIVVSLNYRLGVLGFFNLLGTDVKGNYGMLDQVLALKWVQQNIANFGGDPNNVTIFGESAGAMSAANHLVSPLSKGLFQRVIAQSGSASCVHNGANAESTDDVNTLAKVLNCDVKKDLMSCLQSKKWDEILNAQSNVTYPSNLGPPTITAVTVDGEFLTDSPRALITKPNGTGINSEVQVMTGVTANEGGFWAMMARDSFKDGIDKKFLEQSIRHGMKLYHPQNKLIEDAILFEYLDHSEPNNRLKNRQAFMDLYSDNIFNAPAVSDAKSLASANVPVYFYVFDHLPHFGHIPDWVGSSHGMDLFFSFGAPIQYDGFYELFKVIVPRFSDLEIGLARYTMNMWANFAKHGDPNAGETTPVVTWPRYNSSQHVHLRISLEPKVEHSFRERKVAFWNEFVPELAKQETGRTSGGKHEEKKENVLKQEL